MILRVGAGLLSVAFAARVGLLLTSQEEPLGYDGYYYVAQAESLTREEGLAYPTLTVLVFVPQVILGWVAGGPINGIKWTVLFTAVAFALAETRLLRALAPGQPWRLAILGVLLLSYPVLLFVVEFLKNFLGVVFLLFALVRVEALRGGRNTWRDPGLAALLVAAALSHYLTATFAVLILLATLTAEAVRSRSQRDLRRFALIPLASLVAGILGALACVANGGIDALRTSGHLGRHPSLLALPLLVVLLACSLPARAASGARYDERPASGTWLVQIFFGGAGAFLAPLSVVEVSDFVDQSVDRGLLTLFLVLGALSARHVVSDRRGWRRWLAAAALLGVPPLFVPGLPDGVELSARYAGVRLQEEVDLRTVFSDGVVVAPHGVDYLLRYRFGITSGHDANAYGDAPLYWFVWDSTCLALSGLCDPTVFVDLGAGGVVTDATFRRYTAQRR